MLKQFIIEKIDEEQLTETSGKIVFHLIEEDGTRRTVSGSTFLDENKQARGVSTENIRELPLIESLFSHRHKKMIEVEFDPFNKVYDRETDKTINKLAYEAVVEMQKEKTFTQKISGFLRK